MNKLTVGSNMRWESSRMMLPEHVEALHKHKFEQKKVPKHELDEQELQEIGIVVMDSLKHELEVMITYWQDGFYKELIGIVDKVDTQTKRVKLRLDDDFTYIGFDCLKSVERI
jgi:hypothetical protein